MITLHGEEIRVGDKVWDILRGWGTVSELHEDFTPHPIRVQFPKVNVWFTEDGKRRGSVPIPTLVWQPIDFEIPKKPKPKERAWQWIFFNYQSNRFGITTKHFSTVDDFYSSYPKSSCKAVEPYLQSEIERTIGEEE